MDIKISSVHASTNMLSKKIPDQQKSEKKISKDKSFSEIIKSYMK